LTTAGVVWWQPVKHIRPVGGRTLQVLG